MGQMPTISEDEYIARRDKCSLSDGSLGCGTLMRIITELDMAIATARQRELAEGEQRNWSNAERWSHERQALSKFQGEVRRIVQESRLEMK